MKNVFKNEGGYFLMVVTIIGIILAIIFGAILPQLHTGQQVRAMTNLNELRAYEAAKKGLIAVMLGVEDADNFQELIGYGYPVTAANAGAKTFTIAGEDYAALFPVGETFDVFNSTGNDGTYTVSDISYGSGNTVITVSENVTDGADGDIQRHKGIQWAISQLCGATTTSTNHDEYTDEDGNVQFISGCQGIDFTGNEDGKLQIVILVSRNGSINLPHTNDGNTDPKDDGLFFLMTEP